MIRLLRYLRYRFRPPCATLNEASSHCLVQKFAQFHGHPNAMRVTFLLEGGVINPSGERLVVDRFSLATQRRLPGRWWSAALPSLALPSRPRHQLRTGQQLLKSWFTDLQDDSPGLTLSGLVEPGGHESGYVLFVYFAVGSQAPKIAGDHIPVKLKAHLGNGDVCAVTGRVRIVQAPEKFEQWVPGILEQINQESAGLAKTVPGSILG